MIRRLMLLATLSVLVGVFVLSAPVLAGNSAQPGKVTIQTTTGKPAVVQTSPSKAAAGIQPATTRWNLVGAFRFSLRNWLGLPYIHLGDSKPPVKDEPDKSRVDPRKRNDDVVQDHGGDEV
jgi:hypothetical protein